MYNRWCFVGRQCGVEGVSSVSHSVITVLKRISGHEFTLYRERGCWRMEWVFVFIVAIKWEQKLVYSVWYFSCSSYHDLSNKQEFVTILSSLLSSETPDVLPKLRPQSLIDRSALAIKKEHVEQVLEMKAFVLLCLFLWTWTCGSFLTHAHTLTTQLLHF